MTSALDAVRVARVVPTSPERAFRAWTTPDDVKQWFARYEGFEVPNVDIDLRVGGNYRIEIAGSGVTAAVVGTYQEISPPDRLAFTWGWEDELIDGMKNGETFVVVEFRASDGGTKVTITHERLRTVEAVSFHEWGWTDCLERLERLLDEGRGDEGDGQGSS